MNKYLYFKPGDLVVCLKPNTFDSRYPVTRPMSVGDIGIIKSLPDYPYDDNCSLVHVFMPRINTEVEYFCYRFKKIDESEYAMRLLGMD